MVRYPKRRIKEFLEQLDNYIDQANQCYRRKIVEEEAKVKREEDRKPRRVRATAVPQYQVGSIRS